MNKAPSSILIIQTAFIGDVILTTTLVEKLAKFFPNATIDFLVRNGNDVLLKNNPCINEVLVWNKKEKYQDALRITRVVRSKKYDILINAQRHFTTGFITTFSGARYKIGFVSNPMSFFFDEKHPFKIIRNGKEHEVDRLHNLIAGITDAQPEEPRLYPGEEEEKKISSFIEKPFVTIHPGSVWATKQFPKEKWMQLIEKIPLEKEIYLLGGPDEKDLCAEIRKLGGRDNIHNMAGEVNLIETAALMKHALVNYVNDSAPLHICSAVDAPCIAVFCSTIPEFGFYPRSGKSKVVEIRGELSCRPCGVHGRQKCPEGHFRCALDIDVQDLLADDF